MSDIENFIDPSLEDRSLSYLKKYLASRFGEEWDSYEEETWMANEPLEEVTPLLVAKLRTLKTLESGSDRFYEDPVFALHVADILNGGLPEEDLTSLPEVTSLEWIYAVKKITEMYPYDGDKTALKVLSEYILKEDGFTFVPSVLASAIGMNEDLPGEGFKEDIANKKKAVNMYLALMAKVD